MSVGYTTKESRRTAFWLAVIVIAAIAAPPVLAKLDAVPAPVQHQTYTYSSLPACTVYWEHRTSTQYTSVDVCLRASIDLPAKGLAFVVMHVGYSHDQYRQAWDALKAEQRGRRL